ncbi:MAG TPA: hypothetical protein DCL48_10040, partial [Alphaproteobacteria bacterium]|nr:hypothetical protein [Alphaproteobacteria bacterium]
RLTQVVAMAREEVVLLFALLLAIVGVWSVSGADDTAASVWVAMLAIQSVPYLATLVVAFVSVMPSRVANGEAALQVKRPEPRPAPQAAQQVA